MKKIQELDLTEALKRALLLVDTNKGPILELEYNPKYNDEPQFYQYTAAIKPTNTISDCGYKQKEYTGGMALFREKAAMKALGEAIERYCLSIYHKRKLKYASFNDLKEQALNPGSVVAFSESQLRKQKLQYFRHYNNSKFWWQIGYSLTQNKPIYIPAQLIYVPYYFENEPYIRLPITTGAAAGTSLTGALLRGICEVVERDSFMIYYLNKLTPPLLDLSSSNDKPIVYVSDIFKRYNLDLYVFDITTNVPITSIMAIIIDRTGIGPAVSVGLKSSLDSRVAILGAIEEAQHIRPWIRDELSQLNSEHRKDNFEEDLLERGFFWSELEKIKLLDFFLKSKKVIKVQDFIAQRNNKMNLKDLIKHFKSLNIEILYVDVTTKDIKQNGFYVVKVIIPRLQPLYLSEDFQYFGGTRLYQIPKIIGYKKNFTSEKQLNKIPHPFL